MIKLAIVFLSIFIQLHVRCAPQQVRTDDVEVSRDRSFDDAADEPAIDYKFSLEDGHERQQERREVDGATVVIGFYKYIDPDGKERQIYYKADKKGYHVSYDKPFEFPSAADSEAAKLSSAYLPPSENLIRDVLAPSNSYLPPAPSSNQYLPPNK